VARRQREIARAPCGDEARMVFARTPAQGSEKRPEAAVAGARRRHGLGALQFVLSRQKKKKKKNMKKKKNNGGFVLWKFEKLTDSWSRDQTNLAMHIGVVSGALGILVLVCCQSMFFFKKSNSILTSLFF
jgi:hypothetical protein